MQHLISFGCVFILLMGASFALATENSATIAGAYQVELHDLEGSTFFMQRPGVWMLQLRTPKEHKETTGTGYLVTMFFSKDFSLDKGKFPIRFHYMNEKNTLGGSVIVRGEKRVQFSFDTNGTIEFTRTDDRLQGDFEYTTFDKTREPRQSVTVKGTFDVERGDALK